MAKIILSAQNFDIYEGDGQDPFARTGATSLEMIYNAGAEGVILGHSEVADSPEVVRKKLQTLLQKRSSFGLQFLSKTTILVGESWETFENNAKEYVADVISNDIITILKNTPPDFLEHIVVGYEPKWGSRGSGRDDMPPAGPDLISACAKSIKEQLSKHFGEKIAKKIPVIYGGRSTSERTEQIAADKNISGFILGSACNSVEKTLTIAHAMKKSMGKKKKILHANFKAYNLADSYENTFMN